MLPESDSSVIKQPGTFGPSTIQLQTPHDGRIVGGRHRTQAHDDPSIHMISLAHASRSWRCLRFMSGMPMTADKTQQPPAMMAAISAAYEEDQASSRWAPL